MQSHTSYPGLPQLVPIHIDMCHVNDDINLVEHVFTACMHHNVHRACMQHNVHRACVHISMFSGSRMSTEISVLISNRLSVGKVVNTCSTNVPLHLHVVGQGSKVTHYYYVFIYRRPTFKFKFFRIHII